MNKLATLIGTLALACTAGLPAAHAEERAAYPADVQAAPGTTLSRAAAPVAAGRAAVAAIGDASAYPGTVAPAATRTRAEIDAEIEQARRDGTLLTNEGGLPLIGKAPERASRVAGSARPSL